MARLIAIETSCDETAVAIVERNGDHCRILSSVVSSQVKVHAKFGGIVPEVAARLQMEQMIPVLDAALAEANIKHPEKELDAVAVTGGPGLITSLLVGAETAKSLAFAWKKPLISINHIEGHVLSALPFDPDKQSFRLTIPFPAVGLIVSGGHTEIWSIAGWGQYEKVGSTRDDAVGEAFDKVAQMMDLGYPGGPIVSKLAATVPASQFTLPRPMMKSGDLAMSFSGIKTAVFYTLKKIKKLTPVLKAELCWEFQQAVVDVLVSKTIHAAKGLGAKSILLGGGVSANTVLRSRLESDVRGQLSNVHVYVPQMKFTGDNAVMIGLAATLKLPQKKFQKIEGFRPDPQWEL